MQAGQIVLVDTNIIIEAVRTNCWSAIIGHFVVETVQKCCEEARTGKAHRPGYVEIDEAILRTRLTAHPVTNSELVALGVRDVEASRLDPGERELWAHALSRTDAWVACSCDRGAIKAAVRLGWEDQLVSLEELAHAVGAWTALKQLRGQFKSGRLSEWRTAALLERGFK